MKRLGIVIFTSALLLFLAVIPCLHSAGAQQMAPQTSDVESVRAASKVFVAAISARDIGAMDQVWAHVPYATFIAPLSTTVVVGWDGVRKAWEMRFSQFDRVIISPAEPHIHINGKVAWAVGIEKVALLRKNGDTLNFHAFVTNVFENQDGRWQLVSHQATPLFREAK